jgi:hypothetical protein
MAAFRYASTTIAQGVVVVRAGAGRAGTGSDIRVSFERVLLRIPVIRTSPGDPVRAQPVRLRWPPSACIGTRGTV